MLSSQVSSVICMRIISALTCLCFYWQAVERVLFPHLPAYWANLQAVLDDYSVSNAQVKADGHKVYGAILVSRAVTNILSYSDQLLFSLIFGNILTDSHCFGVLQ